MVNFDHPMPLHIQIKDLLIAEITEGKYEDKIPSERELMERFSVSRSTIRESVNHLVHDGIVEKVHGKGTFITEKKPIHDWLDALHSFTETVQKMGRKPGAKLLDTGLTTTCEKGQQLLHTDELFTIKRLRTADRLPIAIEQHFYKPDFGVQLAQFDLSKATIYDLIEQQLGVVIAEGEQIISCIPIEEEAASYLKLPPGSNVLCIERILTGVDNEVIEYYKSLFHPQHYSLRLKMKRA